MFHLELQRAERFALTEQNYIWLEEEFPSGVSWSHGAWQIALNPSSCGWPQSGILNWHLQQPWRLGPVSRSICCTAISLHLCTQWTCVSWITFKLIWGLCWSDSQPDGAWRKLQLTPQGNPVIHAYHTSSCTLRMSGRFMYNNEEITWHYIHASSLILFWVTDLWLYQSSGQWHEDSSTSLWSVFHLIIGW